MGERREGRGGRGRGKPPQLSCHTPGWGFLEICLPPGLSPLLSLRSRPPYIQLGGLENAVSSASGVWGRAPSEIKFGAF